MYDGQSCPTYSGDVNLKVWMKIDKWKNRGHTRKQMRK
jgi:hypothetical protein